MSDRINEFEIFLLEIFADFVGLSFSITKLSYSSGDWRVSFALSFISRWIDRSLFSALPPPPCPLDSFLKLGGYRNTVIYCRSYCHDLPGESRKPSSWAHAWTAVISYPLDHYVPPPTTGKIGGNHIIYNIAGV